MGSPSWDEESLSRFLSLILRHKPGTIGLELDAQGWADIDDLIIKARAAGRQMNREDIIRTVETNQKKRFSFSPGGLRIRAAQGHSLTVDLGLSPARPPDILYHGTATRFLDAILAEGLVSQSRQFVHLSADIQTAIMVGQRHGKPIVLRVDTLAMFEQGHSLFLAENGVWLTGRVDPSFLQPIA